MKAILVSGLHHWGFSVRVAKASAGGLSYLVPPISTILGSLSRGYCTNYAVKANKSCTDEFIEAYKSSLFWVSYGTEEPLLVPYSDLMREERVPYRRSAYRKAEELVEWFGVSAFGKVYGALAKFNIAILVNDNEGEWVKLTWQMISLGSKESLVTIYNVTVSDVLKSVPEEFYTNYYIPAECLKDYSSFEKVKLPVKGVYNLSSSPSAGVFHDFLIPKVGPLIGGYVKLYKDNVNLDSCAVYKLGREEKYIITLRDGVRKWLQ